MSFDLHRLTHEVAAHGPLIRVVLASVAGSSPREAGAAVHVWAEGQSGTIGGGALEYAAVHRARALLADGGSSHVEPVPLGPALGQCCGGAVVLVHERITQDMLAGLDANAPVARAISATGSAPLWVTRVLAAARGGQPVAGVHWRDGWLVEPVSCLTRPLWIWGAGHVGRALVDVLAPLPEFAITWVDTGATRFPAKVPQNVQVLPAANPAALIPHAPRNAEHLVLTYSHALDLELCDRLLRHGFTCAGLIGSASKWARFRGRLRGLGHSDAEIMRIDCPIGDPALGKHPQAIAVGVASRLLSTQAATARPGQERTA